MEQIYTYIDVITITIFTTAMSWSKTNHIHYHIMYLNGLGNVYEVACKQP